MGASDGGGAFVWNSSDINSFDIAFDTENELKYGEEAQKQEFINALKLGLFNDENGRVPRSTRRRALELMRLGCYSDLLSAEELHVKNAKKENSMFSACGIGAPGPYDDDATHIEEHCRFALSQSFAALRKSEPELCRSFDAHIALHAKRLEGENTEKEKGKENER